MVDRTAVCWIHHQGKYLLMHRTEDAPNNPGKWGLFGGYLEEEETFEQGIRRELYEEIEYTPKQLRHVGTFMLSCMPLREAAFIEEFDDSQRLVQHEGQGMQWFLPEEMPSLDLSSSAREGFRKLQRSGILPQHS